MLYQLSSGGPCVCMSLMYVSIGQLTLRGVAFWPENIRLPSWNSNQSCPICQRVSVLLTKRVPRQRLQHPAPPQRQCRHPPRKTSLNREPTLLPRATTPAWWPGWDCSLTSPTPLSPRTMWVRDLDYTQFIQYLYGVLTWSISFRFVTCGCPIYLIFSPVAFICSSYL